MSKMQRVIRLLAAGIVLVLACLFVTAYGVRYRSPEVSGIAVDKETDKPISGLTVRVSWHAIHDVNLHRLEGNYEIMDIHSAITVTDTNGAFVVPPWGPVTCPTS